MKIIKNIIIVLISAIITMLLIFGAIELQREMKADDIERIDEYHDRRVEIVIEALKRIEGTNYEN